jgi:hypothetical protein
LFILPDVSALRASCSVPSPPRITLTIEHFIPLGMMSLTMVPDESTSAPVMIDCADRHDQQESERPPKHHALHRALNVNQSLLLEKSNS